MPDYIVKAKGIYNGRRYPGETISTDDPLDPVPSWMQLKSDAAKEVEPEVSANISPAAAKLAEDFAINLEDINGTGKGGQITKGDVQRFIDANTKPAVADEGGAGIIGELKDSASDLEVI